MKAWMGVAGLAGLLLVALLLDLRVLRSPCEEAGRAAGGEAGGAAVTRRTHAALKAKTQALAASLRRRRAGSAPPEGVPDPEAAAEEVTSTALPASSTEDIATESPAGSTARGGRAAAGGERDDSPYSAATLFGPAPGTGRNLVVLSVASGSGSEWASLTEANHAAYARHNRYGHARWTAASPAGLRPKWNKMLAIRDQFARGVEVVLFVDADVVFTNFSVSAWDVFRAYSSDTTSLIVARDAASFDRKRGAARRWLMNTGVMLLRESPWSQGLLAQCLQQAPKLSASHHPIQDQYCFMGYLRKCAADVPTVAKTPLERFVNVTFVPQTVMNKFFRHPSVLHRPMYHAKYKGFLSDPLSSRWRPGDWMAHLAGLQDGHKREELQFLVDHAQSWRPDPQRKTWADTSNRAPRPE